MIPNSLVEVKLRHDLTIQLNYGSAFIEKKAGFEDEWIAWVDMENAADYVHIGRAFALFTITTTALTEVNSRADEHVADVNVTYVNLFAQFAVLLWALYKIKFCTEVKYFCSETLQFNEHETSFSEGFKHCTKIASWKERKARSINYETVNARYTITFYYYNKQ